MIWSFFLQKSDTIRKIPLRDVLLVTLRYVVLWKRKAEAWMCEAGAAFGIDKSLVLYI